MPLDCNLPLSWRSSSERMAWTPVKKTATTRAKMRVMLMMKVHEVWQMVKSGSNVLEPIQAVDRSIQACKPLQVTTGGVPKIATGVATMCVSPREKPQRFKFAKLEWTVEAPTTWPSKRGTFFSIAKIQLPGNSAIVTFLGWWVHVTRTQRPQRLIVPFN